MKRLSLYVLCLLAAVLLTSCQATAGGPISGPVIGIGAALLAALDQLLASGVLTADQYLPLATGVQGISSSVATAMDTIATVKSQMAAEQAARWTPAEITGAVTAGTAAAAAISSKVTSVLRDRHYTPEELAERKIKRIRAAAAKKAA